MAVVVQDDFDDNKDPHMSKLGGLMSGQILQDWVEGVTMKLWTTLKVKSAANTSSSHHIFLLD